MKYCPSHYSDACKTCCWQCMGFGMGGTVFRLLPHVYLVAVLTSCVQIVQTYSVKLPTYHLMLQNTSAIVLQKDMTITSRTMTHAPITSHTTQVRCPFCMYCAACMRVGHVETQPSLSFVHPTYDLLHIGNHCAGSAIGQALQFWGPTLAACGHCRHALWTA